MGTGHWALGTRHWALGDAIELVGPVVQPFGLAGRIGGVRGVVWKSSACPWLVAAAMLLGVRGTAWAWSSDWSHTLHFLRGVFMGLEAYRTAHGDWPRDDEDSRWFVKLAREDLIAAYDYNDVDHWSGPVDEWGHSLVYVPPAVGGRGAPVIRSVGENGVDEAGGGDDLTAGGWINVGSYGRKPAGGALAFGAGSIALFAGLVLVMVRKSGRFVAEALSLAAVWAGVTMGVMSSLFYPSRHGRGFVPWAMELHDGGRLLVVCGIAWLGACLVWRFVIADKKRSRSGRGLCTVCGYDMKGLPGNVCPECGEARRCAPETTAPIE